MSGPPYALQRLPAIINFSGGRSSAFMLYHLLEHDDGHLVAAALAPVKRYKKCQIKHWKNLR